MHVIIDRDELPADTFEGYLHGDVSVSFFLSDTPPGKGPRLHTHPYDEVFVIQEGELTFTVGSDTIVAKGGQIVLASAGTPHRFVNTGPTSARHIDIHTSGRMSTEWLEGPEHDESGGTGS